MVSLQSLLGALPLILSVASAATLGSRQAAAQQVVQAASIENVAVRPNGHILATNMNNPSLIEIDPVAKTQSPALRITGATGLSGIGEYMPDVFAIIGGRNIYKVDFTSGTPTSTLVAAISTARNLNGLAVFDNTTVLVADAGAGNVYKFNMNTGDYEVCLEDPTMAPSGGIPFGIDGIKYKDGVVWYTNIFRNSFHKVEVDASLKATGPVTTLWTNLMGDDLCFGPDGMLYIATNGRNSVVKVDPAVGTPSVVAQVQGSTSCAFGRGESDSNVMYVGAGRGVFAVTT